MELKVQIKQAGKRENKIVAAKLLLKEKQAIETAIQAFEDGLVALFIDDKRYEELAEEIELTGDENLTFVRLTMLAGRMW